ncbi:NAD(P)-dependent alcohol dehydrogenase [Maritimibacter sp. UBA3975]|uniref:NAD(P)-dependent alcohol dehydrogenase n=1 Tax=Maritimibacter sp. UBA3975 TaxID=1946833 RepID=UPI0025C516E0|nr:NAD(P)-dependent alcohol dehydrogenase [Maritimibacter sp. UBA3975]|tara:strand:- start:4295 stop:5221 length:927 start_codon:yes stop_codon:yes gene_type:complete
MKAVVMRGYGPGAFAVADVAVPSVGRGAVRVRVAACGANASDWEFATGRPLYGRLARTLMRVRVAGSDVAGVVEAVGEGVSGFAVGDRVVADTFETFGGFAELCVAKAERWVKIPERMDFITAAALPQSGAIALTAFDGTLPQNARVLVNGGGGGAGPLAIQVAKRAGAEVWAVDNAGKQDVMRAAGADHLIDYRETDFAALDSTFDNILDLIATRPMRRVAARLTPRGIYRLVGGATQHLIAAALPPRRTGLLIAHQGPELTARMVAQVARGEITPHIGATVPLGDAPAALARMGAGDVPGKLVITC